MRLTRLRCDTMRLAPLQCDAPIPKMCRRRQVQWRPVYLLFCQLLLKDRGRFLSVNQFKFPASPQIPASRQSTAGIPTPLPSFQPSFTVIPAFFYRHSGLLLPSFRLSFTVIPAQARIYGRRSDITITADYNVGTPASQPVIPTPNRHSGFLLPSFRRKPESMAAGGDITITADYNAGTPASQPVSPSPHSSFRLSFTVIPAFFYRHSGASRNPGASTNQSADTAAGQPPNHQRRNPA